MMTMCSNNDRSDADNGSVRQEIVIACQTQQVSSGRQQNMRERGMKENHRLDAE